VIKRAEKQKEEKIVREDREKKGIVLKNRRENEWSKYYK